MYGLTADEWASVPQEIKDLMATMSLPNDLFSIPPQDRLLADIAEIAALITGLQDAMSYIRAQYLMAITYGTLPDPTLVELNKKHIARVTEQFNAELNVSLIRYKDVLQNVLEHAE